jgi:PAS domain S-box-containing protein
VTDDKRIDSELEEFFDLSIDLLCICGFDGSFKRVNAAFERLLGFPRAVLFERTVFDVTHPDDRQPVQDAVERIAEGHDVIGFEARVVCADGSVTWLEWNTRAVRGRSVVYGVARDTTERRRADAELREAQAELHALADEQAALRRVATLVARGSPQHEIFAAVGREAGALLGADAARVVRYVDDEVDQLGGWIASEYGPLPYGRVERAGTSVSGLVFQTRRTARVDDYMNRGWRLHPHVEALGIQSAVGAPIFVEGRLWGAVLAWLMHSARLPDDAERRLAGFIELVATAVSNAAHRADLDRVLDEQAALRRVATLVAQETPQAEVFGAIAEEIARLLGVDSSGMVRFEEGRFGVVVATSGPIDQVIPAGIRLPIEGASIASAIFRTGAPARIDDYEQASGPWAERVAEAGVRSVVGTPIMVGGRLWGSMMALTHTLPLPPDTESRLGQFTELMATAIANAEARTEVARLADEQAALRRVATLVAEGARPSAVFDAVTAQILELVGSSSVTLSRYEDEHLVVLSTCGTPYVNVGDRYPVGGMNVTSDVLRTGRTARLDDLSQTTGLIGDAARASGARSTVGAPVVVDGRTWGVLAAIWADRGPPPEDMEARMSEFARLLDTAIANADGRDQLTASRARVLAAGDEARRRVVRDLHDGAQQRLVQTIVTLKLARQDPVNADELTAEALETAERAMVELRELAHGILPAVLTRGGLRAGVAAFVARLTLPVEVDVMSDRLPADIEASAYFIVAEALTNVVKHAGATKATVHVAVEDGVLAIEVRDDGIGGANPEGHGLVGIADRVAAHGGGLWIESGNGTALTARLPL